jgi:hypothetical protein
MMLEMERPLPDAVTTAPPPPVAEAPPHHEVFDPPPEDGVPTPRRRRGFGGGRRGIRRPEGEDEGSFDVRNSWQVVVGSILIPLGVVLILLAWYGAAHARVVQQQIPYMVSGGFAGLGCMVVGGLLYWGHWLYRMYDQAELHHEENLKVLEELVRTLGGGVSTGGMVPSGPSAGTAEGRAGSYLATTSGSVYHRSGCPVIAHHPNELRVLGPAALAGLRPCQICSPD